MGQINEKRECSACVYSEIGDQIKTLLPVDWLFQPCYSWCNIILQFVSQGPNHTWSKSAFCLMCSTFLVTSYFLVAMVTGKWKNVLVSVFP